MSINSKSCMMRTSSSPLICRLARSMKNSKDRFPKNGRGKYTGWHRLIRCYLERTNVNDEILIAFEESWEEYVACEKK